MKISKTRLLQIIREEVELREKNTYELDEEELSDKQEKQAIDDEIRADKEAGNLEEEDLLNLLHFIPEGCKTIFNLFVIEGYGHKEIADMLKISEGTSKSQLNVAKTKLKELVNNHYYKNAK